MKVDNIKVVVGKEEQTNNNQVSTQNWYINQCGYDINKSKRATFINGVRGTLFYLKKSSNNEVVFTGSIYNQIADFTGYNISGEYYLECNDIKSYTFKIEENRILKVSQKLALKFMEMSRQDSFDIGGNTGYAWRDSHQFSFELNGLAMMYMANPSYYENMTRDIYKVNECEYEELRTQTEPNIIWLLKFGATRYYKWATENGIKLHALIKGQLAYFLYLYPYISEYVTQEFYTTIRDFTISIWSEEECNKSWYEVEGTLSHNLFKTQSVIGTVKGQLPPGYAVIPNLLMWEVAKRDNLETANNFKNSWLNNLTWLINSVDLTNPKYTKGQRMNEYIGINALTQSYELYPTLCPVNILNKIKNLAEVFISRCDNMWDYKQYSTKNDLSNAAKTIWVNEETTGGLCNQPGNVAGVVGICLSLARIINDELMKNRLKQIAISHVDHMFGRNPLGRHFCYTATSEYDGAKLGWVKRYQGGYGNLGYVLGVLDGSPKNENYPYDPKGNTGYTEGWVAFNSAWNMSIAYLNLENKNTNCIGIFKE